LVVSVDDARFLLVGALAPVILVMAAIVLSRVFDPPEPATGVAPDAVLEAIASVEVEPEPWETPAELAALH
jgi:hypothetical protein